MGFFGLGISTHFPKFRKYFNSDAGTQGCRFFLARFQCNYEISSGIRKCFWFLNLDETDSSVWLRLLFIHFVFHLYVENIWKMLFCIYETLWKCQYWAWTGYVWQHKTSKRLRTPLRNSKYLLDFKMPSIPLLKFLEYRKPVLKKSGILQNLVFTSY